MRRRPQQRADRQGGRRARPRHRLHASRLTRGAGAGRPPGSGSRRPSGAASRPDVFAQALNGLAYGVLLFLLSVGLTLIFGMLDVVNLAHGSFYMLGAYAGLTLIAATGSFWLALAPAPLAVGPGRRPRRARPAPPALSPPPARPGAADLRLHLPLRGPGQVDLGRPHPLDPAARALLRLASRSGGAHLPCVPALRHRLRARWWRALLWLAIERTRLGAIVRAGVYDAEMTAGMGIDIDRVFTAVFAFGAALGGLSGVIAGPIQSAYPPMGASILIPALIVVVVGGLGSLKGSLVGSLIIGQAETFGKAWLPGASMVIIYVVMALVLLFRPQGLFGRPLR